MAASRLPATIRRVRDSDRVKRYTLVPRSSLNGNGTPHGVKRYSLARLGVAPRSALGVDRHERLEQIAEAERRNGGDPGQDKRS
jgi:hypothetical protein